MSAYVYLYPRRTKKYARILPGGQNFVEVKRLIMMGELLQYYYHTVLVVLQYKQEDPGSSVNKQVDFTDQLCYYSTLL